MSIGDCCYHGGAFFEAIGDGFDDLRRHERIVNADVLDAWFPPSPKVIAALTDHLSWIVRTSPPTHADGLISATCRQFGLKRENICVGAGSSDLIFRLWRQLVGRGGRVLIPEPSYGEYAFVAKCVLGADVEAHTLSRSDGFRLNVERYVDQLKKKRHDLALLVNPNNPTGGLLSLDEIRYVMANKPRETVIWVDEAYIDYSGDSASVQSWVASEPSLVVCKSLSKGFALSGLRVAYAVASPSLAKSGRESMPPWGVSLPAQIAAVVAIGDTGYYRDQYREMGILRCELLANLRKELPEIDWRGTPANFVLGLLPERGATSGTVAAATRRHGVFVRDLGPSAPSLANVGLRIAVRSCPENAITIDALVKVMRDLSAGVDADSSLSDRSRSAPGLRSRA